MFIVLIICVDIVQRSFKNIDINCFKLPYSVCCSMLRTYLNHAPSVCKSKFKKDINQFEYDERKARKLERGIGNLRYSDRLMRLYLTTFEQRRKRNDLIQIYKIINSLEKINFNNGIHLTRSNKILKDQSIKLRNELIKNRSSRYNFFTNWIGNDWNVFKK